MRERLSTERWRALIPHLDHVLDLSPDERQPWLSSLREKDPALADDLQALVQRHDAIEEGFLGEGPDAPVPVSSLAGLAAGAYVLRSQLGQGGMGSVWLAERSDGRYQGTAAVKVLNAALAGRAGEARFRREASILARLRHPHIAQLIDAGVAPLGHPYLVLERVDGERIDRHCDARNLPVEARIHLFLDVLAAVAHAHANLIVHRDIKPSNVLVAADGQVKLLDFGVAKLLESDETGELTVVTREGESALTPGYAAPEQLTGGDVTTATDVYALGVLLYLLLSGRHPARPQSSSAAELIRAIVDTQPARVSDAVGSADRSEPSPLERAARRGSTPRKLRSTLRGDLDNIVGKALKKRPTERYASAEAMADDLRRYLDRQPVRARPDSLAYRARKFVARNRVVLGAATVAVAALAASAAVAVWQARTAARERDRALVRLQRAEAADDLAGFLLEEATPSGGRPLTNAEMLDRGEALIERRYAGDPALRVHMLLTLADRYHQNNQFDRMRSTLDRAFSAARGLDDVALRSRTGCAWAFVLADEGRFDEAFPLLDAALADLAPLPEAAADEAYCRVYEAIIANRKGDSGRSVPAAERAVALEEGRHGPPGRGFEALSVLASSYHVAGRSGAADRVFRRLESFMESQGLERTRDAASVLSNWSLMLQRRGQYLQALPIAERAVRVARERDTDAGAAIAHLRNLGNALCTVGRCAEALPPLEEALAKARASRSSRRVSDCLQYLAMAYRALGRFDEAARALQEAEGALRALPADHIAAAGLDVQAAQLALARGDVPGAIALGERAASPQAVQVSDYYALLGGLALAEAHNANRDFAAARSAAQRALELAVLRLDEMKQSSHTGQARLELGTALAGLGNTKDAHDELTKALDDLRSSLGPDAPDTRRALAQRERLGPSSHDTPTGRR
jgi:eukaryotic-like serine/threonine-protein kinase